MCIYSALALEIFVVLDSSSLSPSFSSFVALTYQYIMCELVSHVYDVGVFHVSLHDERAIRLHL
jgi:hypothetical protein